MHSLSRILLSAASSRSLFSSAISRLSLSKRASLILTAYDLAFVASWARVSTLAPFIAVPVSIGDMLGMSLREGIVRSAGGEGGAPLLVVFAKFLITLSGMGGGAPPELGALGSGSSENCGGAGGGGGAVDSWTGAGAGAGAGGSGFGGASTWAFC